MMMRFKFEFANDEEEHSIESEINNTYLVDKVAILENRLCMFFEQIGAVDSDEKVFLKIVDKDEYEALSNFLKDYRQEQLGLVESSSRTELIQFHYKGMSATVECKSDDNENFEPDDPCYIGTLNTGNYDRVYFHGDSLDATWDSFESCVDLYMSMKETLRNEEMDRG